MKSGTKLLGSAVGVFCMALFCVCHLQAQETAETKYETLEIADQYKDPPSAGATAADRASLNAKRRARRTMQTAVGELMKGKSSSVSTSDMETWFNGYVIPKMTQTDDASLGDLGKNRENFFRQYLTPASNSQLRGRLLQLVVPKMQQVAEGNFHPACRINAVVLLSQLNTREGNRSARTLPVPYAAMLPWLRKVVKENTFPEYLKPPAIAGIERHAAVRGPKTNQAFSDQEATDLANDMVSVLQLKDVEGIDPDLVYWMQRRAIHILGYIGTPGAGGSFAKVLRDQFMDDKKDMNTRLDAIAAYGILNFTDQKEDAELKTVVPRIGALLAKAAEDESKYIDKKISDIRLTVKFLDGKEASADEGSRKRKGSVGLGQGADSGGPGGGAGAKKKDIPEVLPVYQRELVRRRIKHHAYVTLVALAGDDRRTTRLPGLKDYAEGTEEETLINQLIKDINSLMRGADVREPEPKEEDDDDDKDKDKDKDKEKEEVRTQSRADELKEALANASLKIQSTIERFGPKDASEADGSSADAGDASSAGQ